MSFASDIKKEICTAEMPEICCMRAELAGIIGVGAALSGGIIKFKTEKAFVAQHVYTLIHGLYGIKADSCVTEGGMFEISADNANSLKILRDLRLADTPVHIHSDIMRNECCRRSVIKGAFFGGGSVSNPKKGYHCEFTTGRYTVCSDLCAILKHYEIYPKQIVRNGNHICYIKDSEQIENLLALLGAHNQMMEFLNVKIEKEMRNSTNRRVNCEAANIVKAANAGAIQRNAIIKIKNTVGFDSLPPALLSLAVERLNNSESSLSERASKLGVSKSCINHRMRKLISIAEGTEE